MTFVWLSLWLAGARAGPTADRALVEARTWLGTPYSWNGRGTTSLPNLDCLGLLFRAYGQATGTSWRLYAVNPSELVAGGRLGQPVPGLSAVQRAALPMDALVPGDVLYLLLAGYRIPDAPLWTHDGVEYWPWHTALYVGNGLVLDAHPANAVIEEPLMGLAFDALYVTRVPG